MSEQPDAMQQQPSQMKFKIILKPGVLDKQSKKDRAKKKDRMALTSAIPEAVSLIPPAATENKFTRKLCNVLDALTFTVNDYIIHNLDNESTSQEYKKQLLNGLGKIRDDFVTLRSGNSIPVLGSQPDK